MNDKIRNEVVHELIAHQRITERDSENWIADTVVGGQPFTVAEHAVQQTGYAFKEAAFFNYLIKEEIDDAFVELLAEYQIFKNLPDFTKYTNKGVDNENHFGEHYCCLINALIQLGCDGSVLLEARTCITGLFVPKSALKEFCDIARIKIKLYWYENDTKQGKKLKNANMWDKTNECLKDAPMFEIGIIDSHSVVTMLLTKILILVNMQYKIIQKLNIKQIGGYHPKNREQKEKIFCGFCTKCLKERNNFSEKSELTRLIWRHCIMVVKRI